MQRLSVTAVTELRTQEAVNFPHVDAGRAGEAPGKGLVVAEAGSSRNS
jgi:hypothetical protein